MRFIYLLNIIVAGWIGISSLFFPVYAAKNIFSNAYPQTEIIRLVGCLWLAIAVLSVAGIGYPVSFSPVLLLQLIYKSSWLLFVALPAIQHKQPFPEGMALFFLLWVIMLPFFIPWKALFQGI